MLEKVALVYGGTDNVIVTAGIFVPHSTDGKISDDKWDLTFDESAKGGYISADEARRPEFRCPTMFLGRNLTTIVINVSAPSPSLP